MMRRMNRFERATRLAALVGALALVVACEEHDLGETCGGTTDALGGEIILGEEPVLEAVRMQRDGNCESFQCLTHRGMAPYCTRTCEYEAPEKKKACAADRDCGRSEYCLDGQCADDDCPAGFWCRQVQETGPLASQRYCVRREGCRSNFDCEDIAENVCQRVGCLDSCLTATGACDEHALVCAPRGELPCACPGEDADPRVTCSDEQLVCLPPGATQSWPTGAVEQRGVCLRKGQQVTPTATSTTP